MSDGIIGFGASLTVYPASATSSTTAIGNITTLNIDGVEIEPVDISTMDSTSGYREYIRGMKNPGTLSLDMNYDGTAAGTADALNTLKDSTATNLVWKITFNDDTTASNKSTFACAGFLSSIATAIPYEDKVTQAVKIQLSGVPTYTDHA